MAGEEKISVYRVSRLRTAGYPAAGLLGAAVAVFRWLLSGDTVLLRVCAVLVPFAFFMWFYLRGIVLKIDTRGISLHWPLQGMKRLEWDSIVQVRRSSAPPGRNFFIDLSAGPDSCIQFNPFFFDRPEEIIKELNAHLRFELLGEDSAREKVLFAELAVASPDRPGISRANWILIAFFLAVLALALFYILK